MNQDYKADRVFPQDFKAALFLLNRHCMDSHKFESDFPSNSTIIKADALIADFQYLDFNWAVDICVIDYLQHNFNWMGLFLMRRICFKMASN